MFDLITTSATHAYLPYFDKAFIRGQIRLGLDTTAGTSAAVPEGSGCPNADSSQAWIDSLPMKASGTSSSTPTPFAR